MRESEKFFSLEILIKSTILTVVYLTQVSMTSKITERHHKLIKKYTNLMNMLKSWKVQSQSGVHHIGRNVSK